jgi:hypothetical protein
MTMKERERDRRNLNPHAEAIAAMYLWGSQYAAQNGGSMDFWDSLPEGRKRLARELVERVKRTGGENDRSAT